MFASTIGRDDLGIPLYHLQRGMAKQGLEGEQIAAIAQVVGGKGVAELVRIGFHAGALADAMNQLPQHIPRQ